MTSLAERADAFEKCMDSARDEHRLVCDELNVNTMKPWTDEELESSGAAAWPESAALPSRAWGEETTPPSAWGYGLSGGYTYENCIMATGRYITVKILKHLVKGRDGAALADAEGAVRALLALSREGDKVEDGLLPKPLGGLEKASQSTGISNDQYEHALLGFWRFRNVCPTSPLIPEIESAIVRWTDFFVRNDFSYKMHPKQWVCTDPTDMGDGLRVYVGRHTLGLYLPMCIMSRELTGDAGSWREFAAAIRQGRQPVCNIHDSVKTMELYQALYDAAMAGKSGVVFSKRS